MGADSRNGADRAELERLLATYGADQRRWPAGAADRAGAWSGADEALHRARAEARALDRVLAAASEPEPAEVRRLADRIVSAARHAPQQPARLEGAIGDLAAARAAARPRAERPSPRQLWQLGAAMAAALLIGVYLGASDLVGPALDGVTGLAGLSGDGDTLVAALDAAEPYGPDEDAL